MKRACRSRCGAGFNRLDQESSALGGSEGTALGGIAQWPEQEEAAIVIAYVGCGDRSGVVECMDHQGQGFEPRIQTAGAHDRLFSQDLDEAPRRLERFAHVPLRLARDLAEQLVRIGERGIALLDVAEPCDGRASSQDQCGEQHAEMNVERIAAAGAAGARRADRHIWAVSVRQCQYG